MSLSSASAKDVALDQASPRTSVHATPHLFYRSLRAVKVLLAALRSTLTVLAPREEVRIGSR